jgi:O-antigen ligase
VTRTTASLAVDRGREVPEFAPAAAATPERARGFLVRNLVIQTALCVALPTALLAAGAARLAGIAFWGAASILLARLALLRRSDAFLCLLLAISPFINFLRGSLFYNVVGVVFLAGVALRFATAPGAFRRYLGRQPLVPWLLFLLFGFYLVSFVLTGRYDVNSRVFEFWLALVATLIVGRSLSLLRATLPALLLSSMALAAALLPHLENTGRDRLGIVALEGRSFGNPIQLGLPLALIFLALVVDRGFWFGLEGRRGARAALLVAVTALLALTTSRASWFVALAGLVVVGLFGRRSRAAVVVAAFAGVLAVQAVRSSSAGGAFDAGLQRTFGQNRTLRNRTGGRSDQWIVAWHAATESAGSLLHGYGPGLGERVYAEKSLETPGVEFQVGQEMSLHSWYMQLLVETGFVGLIVFGAWLVAAAARIISWTRRRRLLYPAVCFLGYLLISATVSGTDTTSGVFLGVGLLAAAQRGRRSLARPPAATRRKVRISPEVREDVSSVTGQR